MTSASALHIQGRRLRYVEVARAADGPSVVTVGQHVLEEEGLQGLLGADAELSREGRDTLEKAQDALSAEKGRVVVPPSAVYSFFVPLPAEAPGERRQHVLQQTALVTGTETVSHLHVEAAEVRPAPDQEGRPYEWVHVMAVPNEARTQIGSVFGGAEDEWDWMVSSEAVAYVPRADAADAGAPFALLAGEYETHTEFALVHEGDWHHAQYTEAPEHAEDLGYSVRSFLNGVGVSPGAVGQVATYGAPMTPAHRSVLEAEVGPEAAALDPFARIADEPAGEGEPSAFAPCVGAALHALDD